MVMSLMCILSSVPTKIPDPSYLSFFWNFKILVYPKSEIVSENSLSIPCQLPELYSMFVQERLICLWTWKDLQKTVFEQKYIFSKNTRIKLMVITYKTMFTFIPTDVSYLRRRSLICLFNFQFFSANQKYKKYSIMKL